MADMEIIFHQIIVEIKSKLSGLYKKGSHLVLVFVKTFQKVVQQVKQLKVCLDCFELVGN